MFIPDEFLLKVEKPARYIGNEVNIIKKDLKDIAIRFGFCFPDVYEVGMSNLGSSILYYFLNEREDTFCERAYAPWHDMEAIMREHNFPLFALETGDNLKDFDILGFTLQYEMSYTNVLNMMDLSGIPVYSKDRDDTDPIICCGGPCSFNPEPLADFVDFFYIGEAEVSFNEVLDAYKENKDKKGSKDDFLKAINNILGIYVPKFHQKGQIVKKAFVKDFDNCYFPKKELVPFIETVHDRSTIELFRGCKRGCRFCQAGFISRPVREKKAETLINQADNLIKNSGHEELSLVSLSTSDYSEFPLLTEGLIEKFKKEQVNLSLPSLRLDAFSLSVMEKIQGARKSSLTFAPEAGSQRLRDVINKGISQEDIENGFRVMFSGGYNRIKIYVMIGLPTETQEDLQGIIDLADKIVSIYYERSKKERNGGLSLHVSAACFIPKPFTPFQWFAQNDTDTFREKQFFLKDALKKKGIKFSYHHPNVSLIEAALARGDRRLSSVIYNAFKLGAKFDGWSEFFNMDIWNQAFLDSDLTIEEYAHKERDFSDELPWDFIDCGVTKKFLVDEMIKANNVTVSPNCGEKCSNCGIIAFSEGDMCGN